MWVHLAQFPFATAAMQMKIEIKSENSVRYSGSVALEHHTTLDCVAVQHFCVQNGWVVG